MRIRTTTRPGASPHAISITPATNHGARPDHGWVPSPQAFSTAACWPLVAGLGADPAPDATTAISRAALRRAVTIEEVRA
jgi:hypothetical protein